MTPEDLLCRYNYNIEVCLASAVVLKLQLTESLHHVQ